MTKVEAFAPAKINLTLHVTGQRADGYHLLDSLVAFADIGDRITVEAAGELSLSVTGPMAAGIPADERNLVWRAARVMDVPAAITLEKHLPHAAGLGGGSSDAAATLRALSELSGKPLPNGTEVLGADVPVCLTPKAQRMQAIGEDLAPVSLPDMPAVLVNPGIQVPTADVFKSLASKANPPMGEIPADISPTAFGDWLCGQRNDLQAPAIALAPEIETVLEVLNQSQGSLCARMSGSGSTCFALFADPDLAGKAARSVSAAHPVWWVRAVVLS